MVDVRPLDGRRATDSEIDEYHELWSAVCRVDYPELPVPTRAASAAGLLTSQLHLGERLLWLARLDGRLVGSASINLPADDNDRIAIARIIVHPDQRRQGIATEILRVVALTLRERGRTHIEGWDVTEGGTGAGWTRALGFRVVNASVLQILEFAESDPSRWDAAVPAGYRLVRWVDAAPDDLVESYAKALNAMADAPLGESGLTESAWSVERVRREEAVYRDNGITRWTIVAVTGSGEVAGLTTVQLRPLNPERLVQAETAVLAAHRGHGLGMALKGAMLRWVRADTGGLKQVWTGTGAANTHMIDVNHRLGYRTVRRFSAVSRELAGL
ncbi:GNAT family N-acetyltransferase [Kutzneria buriramensis]|uniref:N-acetylglutamate synthase-like GNAT family acetyltransferase n=1 Tax=Kutzneria buriramensis TaxID=1045776 RepID=A0A3E0HQ56_9PSEU|nr:GNAT family N-acetyltransferase [Kutzneria buriramensis]REH48548.1 N-acetylglutamate synthase-like GNAT family acetyltransferase [Kutzneria buriramensis]